MKAEFPVLLDLENLPSGRKIYFASDFHLGAPDPKSSLEREKKLVRWLEMAQKDAEAIFLLGDIYDFWYEYRTAIPKGFIRFQGKLAELSDQGIKIFMFTGNHDMWLFDYYPKELGIPIIRKNVEIKVGSTKLLIGHGDGLGPGDNTYKALKKVFANPVCQWLFKWIHPDVGIRIANAWSRKSRISNTKSHDFKEESERLIHYCREVEKVSHYDYYVFGHRHLPLEIEIGEKSRYFNLGEWVNFSPYGVFSNLGFQLLEFEGKGK